MTVTTTMTRVVAALAAVAALGACATAHAAGRAIEDVRFSRQNGVSRAEVVLACPVRYLSHTPESGLDVQVRVALEPECVAALGAGVRSELFEPPAGNLAGLKQAVFDTTVEDRVARIALNFGRIVRYSVSQGANRDTLRIEIAEGGATSDADRLPSVEPTVAQVPSLPPPRVERAPERPAVPAPAPAPAAAPPPSIDSPAPATERRPLRLVQPAEARVERFAIQLAAGPGAAGEVGSLAEHQGELLYVNERRAGAREWQELRLGFFASENDARARLSGLAAAFPSAVIAIATVDEQDAALNERRLVVSASTGENSSAAGDTAAERELPHLAPERLAALVAEGNDAMLAASYDRAIQIYTRLADEPGYDGRREARERLGLARERKGQIAQARHEYDVYLAEFPDGADADRVRQRLAGLVAAAAPVTSAERIEAAAAPERTWEYDGGVAQYYRRDVYRPLDGLPDETLQSALVSNINLIVRRHGERFELATRFDAQYRYNLNYERGIAEDDERAAWRDPADQLYLTNAYVSVADQEHDWSARVGRQSLHESGVLGRFDGARAEYQWKPKLGFNLTLGSPVEYPRHGVDKHRDFVAFSADMDELVKQWDMSFFGVMQNVDGVVDRQAVGAEARYRGNDWSVVSSVDYDVSFGVLNSALASANWRATEKITLNGRLNVGAAPFLTTHNALIGQSAQTIEEMQRNYTERQIRRVARNRTAQAQDGSLGMSMPLFDRYQLNVDLMFSEFDATVGSAGVAGIPASGAQTFLQATLVGSSVLKAGDTTIFSLRHAEQRNAISDTVVFDVRLPGAQKVRWNPRIALTSRENLSDGSDQIIAAPMLRLALRWPNHHRFELELGGQWSDKELPAPDPFLADDEEPSEKYSAYFLNAGYWWEF